MWFQDHRNERRSILVPSYVQSDDMIGDDACVREPSQDPTRVPDAVWTEAKRRLGVIRPLAENESRTRADVVAAANALGFRLSQTYVLLDRYLADPTTTSLIPRRRGPSVGSSRLPREIDALIDKSIESTYLSTQRVRLSDLVNEVRKRCHGMGIRPPGRKAITKRLRAKPRATVVARREGRHAARARLAPVLGSLESSAPLAIVQIDHTPVDVIVVDSVTRAPIQRPWLTLAIDVYSRCVVGFHLSLEAPSATSVALCIAHAALPKEGWLSQRGIAETWPVSGIMRTLHLDNAKEFRSEALRRGCEQYGISLDYRPVRTPHYGGHIERLIGTLMGKVHLLPGTTVSNVQAKGDNDPEKTAAMTLSEVERWLGHAITGVYHRDLHRMINTTPLAAWEAGTSTRAPATAVTDARRFLIDFLPIERRLVRREGVSLHSIGYWADVLTTWIGDPEPMTVRYDPRDLSRIYLQGPDGVYYDLGYRDVRRPPISLWEHRRALKRLREEGYAHVDEGSIFRTVERMREITDAANSATKGARRERERRPRAAARVAAERDPASLPTAPSLSSNDAESATSGLFSVEEWT